ncbi:MAG: TetR family transcriptional regulator [Actinomycetota bacterium]|nr:TetR family transcriptional regulator [Actinomycetota bacterium]
MARIGERRAPARPASDEQESRRATILAAAARLGAVRELDHIHAREIATEAGVALRTLYRYYPSKHHIFAAVLTDQVARFRPPEPTGNAVDDITALMVTACRNLLRYKHLAHAMITSTQIVRAQSGAAEDDPTLRDLIVRTAGVGVADPEQVRRARLIQQAAFGVMTWTVGGALSAQEALADLETACRLLAAGAF